MLETVLAAAEPEESLSPPDPWPGLLGPGLGLGREDKGGRGFQQGRARAAAGRGLLARWSCRSEHRAGTGRILGNPLAPGEPQGAARDTQPRTPLVPLGVVLHGNSSKQDFYYRSHVRQYAAVSNFLCDLV